MSSLNRRNFLSLLGAAGVAASMPGTSLAAPAPKAESFTFVFLTDTHIQPELDAAHGTDMAFRKVRGMNPEFVIQGGDHVFDSLGVPKQRASSLFDLYEKTEQDLGLKVYHTIGNHDCLGIYPASGIAPTDPYYGKKLYEERVGKTYYSFDRNGHHFIVLDSIEFTPARQYEGRINQQQLAWLASDLKALPAGTPIIIAVHVPLVTAFDNYAPEPKPPVPGAPPPAHGLSVANSNEVVDMLTGHNVLGVLQGHTHINERVEYKGIPYITSGAVSGNWWHGTRMGFPEGFTVVTVENGRLTTRYETYGFKTVAPQNT